MLFRSVAREGKFFSDQRLHVKTGENDFDRVGKSGISRLDCVAKDCKNCGDQFNKELLKVHRARRRKNKKESERNLDNQTWQKMIWQWILP